MRWIVARRRLVRVATVRRGCVVPTCGSRARRYSAAIAVDTAMAEPMRKMSKRIVKAGFTMASYIRSKVP